MTSNWTRRAISLPGDKFASQFIKQIDDGVKLDLINDNNDVSGTADPIQLCPEPALTEHDTIRPTGRITPHKHSTVKALSMISILMCVFKCTNQTVALWMPTDSSWLTPANVMVLD